MRLFAAGRAGRLPGGDHFTSVALGLYLGAAVLTTVPAIGHGTSHFLAGGAAGHGEAAPGDHLQTIYRLWLPGHQIEHGRYPWRDPYSFRPEAHAQLNPAAWPFGLAFWPLWRAFGLVVAWNLFVLLTLAAAGLVTCAWLRELGLGRAAALAGGLAFEIAPYRAAQSTAHLLAAMSILVPLSLWAFERARRGSVWWHAVSAAALASISLSGQVHLAVGAIPFYAAYVTIRTAPANRRRQLTAAAGVLALALAAGSLVRVFLIEDSVSERGSSLGDVGRASAGWLDLLVRHERHGLESFVFLGWVTPLVAAAGLYLLIRRRDYQLAAVLGLGALAPILFALGTNTPLYEPTRFLVPALRYPRFPERLLPIACLALAALVAFAVQAAIDFDPRRLPKLHSATWVRRPVAVAAVALAALLADLHVTVFEATAADGGNKAYAALRSTAGRPLELPVFRPGVSGASYLYYETQARRERPGGYSALAPPAAERVARKLLPLDCGDWTTHPRKLLLRLGVRSIVFHGGVFAGDPEAPRTGWLAWRALVRHGYRPVARDGSVILLERTKGGPPPPSPMRPPPRTDLLFCEGWFTNDGDGQAMSLNHASLWAYNAGGADLRLIMRAAARLRVRFGIDGHRHFAGTVSELRLVRVRLGGEGWHLITLDSRLIEAHGRREGARIVAYAAG